MLRPPPRSPLFPYTTLFRVTSPRDASRLFVRLQPVDGIERDPSLAADLEVEVRAAVARLPADVADDLPFDHALPLCHGGGIAQVPVEAVVATPVVEQHRREVGP